MIIGIGLVVLAAVLEGVFLLPMSRTRQWAWEHTWLAFSFAGMLVCNWVLTWILLPNPVAIYMAVARQELLVLACFGMAWGVSAVLFGLGMEMLGLSLGYPVIMGLNTIIGTFVPLLWLYGGSMFAGRRLLIAIGTATAIGGIILCSVAGAFKEHAPTLVKTRSRFLPGLIVAIGAGLLGCLPNIGLQYGTHIVRSAQILGATPGLAGNAIWFIFFTFGGLVNVLYCCWLMIRNNNLRTLFAAKSVTNWGLAFAMGAMWIGSFYLYGVGTTWIGIGGATVAWPILISLSIGIGVLCGLAKGEWRGAPVAAKNLLWTGLSMILAAVLVTPFGANSH